MPALAHVIEIYPGIDGTPSTRVLGSHCRPRYRIASVWLPVNANSCCRTATRRNTRSEEHTSELQSQSNLVCRLLLEKKKKIKQIQYSHYHNYKKRIVVYVSLTMRCSTLRAV